MRPLQFHSQEPDQQRGQEPRHPAKARTYSEDQKEELGVEKEDKEAQFIVNRKQGEMADSITWEEVEHNTRQDSALQALKDIKKGTLRKEAKA